MDKFTKNTERAETSCDGEFLYVLFPHFAFNNKQKILLPIP
jgi:hypothetical protein